jgi:hypothetical protein
VRHAGSWPDHSPGAVNAWLLLVTTKAPDWRDPLVVWPSGPPTIGTPHEGFFYPDPRGFWAEVRRWITELLVVRAPEFRVTEALSVSALVHTGDDPQRVARLRATCRPRVELFLDEPAWVTAAPDVPVANLAIPDPHRADQSYVGLWSERAVDGVVVGKAPQHPSAHRFYRWEDMARFLRAVP